MAKQQPAAAAGSGAAKAAVAAPPLPPADFKTAAAAVSTSESLCYRQSVVANDDTTPTYITLDKQYRFVKRLASGAYGVVVQCLDTLSNKHVAVKCVSITGQSEMVTTLRELICLHRLRGHPNVITILDVMPLYYKTNDTMAYVLPLMKHGTLQEYMAKSSFRYSDHIGKTILYKLLCAVDYMHSAGLTHRDIKPENVLLGDTPYDVNLSDFGTGRSIDGTSTDDTQFLSQEVTTRWYCAPEVLLQRHPDLKRTATSARYGYKADMWAIGCLFAWMICRGIPLWRASNNVEQLLSILNDVGVPTDLVLCKIATPQWRRWASALALRNPQPAPSRLWTHITSRDPGRCPHARELLMGLLAVDPDARWSARRALKSPFFHGVREPEVEALAVRLPHGLSWDERTWQGVLPTDRVRLHELLWRRVLCARPDMREMYVNWCHVNIPWMPLGVHDQRSKSLAAYGYDDTLAVIRAPLPLLPMSPPGAKRTVAVTAAAAAVVVVPPMPRAAAAAAAAPGVSKRNRKSGSERDSLDAFVAAAASRQPPLKTLRLR